MTAEEIIKSPMFRIVKKGMMRKYPWVKDMEVDTSEPLEKYKTTYFVNLTIDPHTLNEMEDLGGVSSWIDRLGDNSFSFLAMFFRDTDKPRKIQHEMEDDIEHIQSNDATKQFKLDKRLAIGEYIYNPKLTPPNKDIPTDNKSVDN